MHSGIYKDCIKKQKELENEESDGGNNAENELDGDNAVKDFKELDAANLDKNNKPTRKRKRKQIKVHICVQFLTAHIIFGPTYRLTVT